MRAYRITSPAAAPALAQTPPAGNLGQGRARVLLVYTTDTNSTRQVAESVAADVRTVVGAGRTAAGTGAEVQPKDVASFDALIFGTPTLKSLGKQSLGGPCEPAVVK